MLTFILDLSIIILFIYLFKFIDKKYLLYAKLLSIVKNKLNVNINTFIGFYVVFGGIILAFICTNINISDQLFKILVFLYVSLSISLVNRTKK